MQNTPTERKYTRVNRSKKKQQKKNIFSRAVDKLSARFSRGTSILIVTCCTIAIIAGLIFATVCAVNAINAEIERQHQIKLEEEEKARLEEEERARQEAEAERLKQEQLAKEKIQKEYNAVMNLSSLGLTSKQLSITPFMQYPEYPAGCEPMALTNMLKYYGFNMAKNTIISNYLAYHSYNFVDFYMGSPKSAG